ncbi:MAG: hypothetical protein E6Q97_16555, partial [Desulfurellales bacterium]
MKRILPLLILACFGAFGQVVPIQLYRTNSVLASPTNAWSANSVALTLNPLSQFASTTSSQLAGVLSDETGSGSVVFSASPTLTGTALADALTMSGRLINSANGALSTPVFRMTGTPITGGTASTTAPLVKIGSGADDDYSTSGNMLVVNSPAAFAGYLQQWSINGSQRVVIDSVAGTAGRISITRRSNDTLTATIDGTDYIGTGDGLRLNYSGGSTSRIALESGQIQINGNLIAQAGNSLGWSDLFLRRAAAANIQFGAADAAAPVAQTISVQNVVAGTTDTAGVNTTWNASRGTGTGTGGSHIFQTAAPGSTGSTQNALVGQLYVRPLGGIQIGGANANAPWLFPFS